MATVTTATTKDIVIKSLKTVLTNAQIKSLPSTPVELVPPPGEGKILIFFSAIFSRPPFAVDYGNLQDFDGLYISYGSLGYELSEGFWNDSTAGMDSLTALLTTQTEPRSVFRDNAYISRQGIYTRPIQINGGNDTDNVGLALLGNMDESHGDFTGGDESNTIEITVMFSIVDA